MPELKQQIRSGERLLRVEILEREIARILRTRTSWQAELHDEDRLGHAIAARFAATDQDSRDRSALINGIQRDEFEGHASHGREDCPNPRR